MLASPDDHVVECSEDVNEPICLRVGFGTVQHDGENFGYLRVILWVRMQSGELVTKDYERSGKEEVSSVPLVNYTLS